jgi:hypothetical protein
VETIISLSSKSNYMNEISCKFIPFLSGIYFESFVQNANFLAIFLTLPRLLDFQNKISMQFDAVLTMFKGGSWAVITNDVIKCFDRVERM